MKTNKSYFVLNETFWLSTDNYSFHYRQDRYSPEIIHVELFNKNNLVHKQIVFSERYGIKLDHFQVINELESKILLNELNQNGLRQIINP